MNRRRFCQTVLLSVGLSLLLATGAFARGGGRVGGGGGLNPSDRELRSVDEILNASDSIGERANQVFASRDLVLPDAAKKRADDSDGQSRAAVAPVAKRAEGEETTGGPMAMGPIVVAVGAGVLAIGCLVLLTAKVMAGRREQLPPPMMFDFSQAARS